MKVDDLDVVAAADRGLLEEWVVGLDALGELIGHRRRSGRHRRLVGRYRYSHRVRCVHTGLLHPRTIEAQSDPSVGMRIGPAADQVNTYIYVLR